MKKFLAIQALLIVLAGFVASHWVDVSQAHGGLLFNRRRQVFRQPIVRQPVFNRRAVSTHRTVCGGGGCGGYRRVVHRNLDLTRFQDTGFARLKIVGRSIVENPRDQFRGVASRSNPFGFNDHLTLDQYGVLRGVRDPNTITQLVDFYGKNLDNFSGHNLQKVVAFLNRYDNGNPGLRGALFAGVADRVGGQGMGVIPKDPGYEAFSHEKIRSAALAFVINSMSNSCTQVPVFPEQARGGVIAKDLNGIFTNQRLATLQRHNPYACGNPNVPARVDWLVDRALTPETYYAVRGTGNNLDEIGFQYGIRTEQRDRVDNNGKRIDRILVADADPNDHESAVGVNPQRVLEVQERAGLPGRAVYRSYDFNANPDSGSETASKDVFAQGINFDADASEYIAEKCNGYLDFWLTNNDNKRARSAPREIASHGGEAVIAQENCTKCHWDALWGGGNRKFGELLDRGGKKEVVPYTDHSAKLSASFGTDFSSNPQYAQRARETTENFRLAKIATGSWLAAPKDARFPDPDPTIPGGRSLAIPYDMKKEYRRPPTLAQMAEELGTTPSPQLAAILQVPPSGSLSREDFERKFCFARSQLGLATAVPPLEVAPGVGNGHGGAGFSGRGQPSVIRRPADG